MKVTKLKIFLSIIIILILALVVFVATRSASEETSGKYDAFTTCLKNKGAIFYGAFWCPHCQAEKKLFGTSEKLVPYVECSTPDMKGQTQICQDKKITGYPTWIFADGSSLKGEVSFEMLAQKTSCILPQ